jgi:flagellar biosynthesis/type III secretory pathway protein FliH
VPAPAAWDSAALAAYEQSFQEASGSSVDRGRRDLRQMEAELADATARCLAAVEAARKLMVRRSLEIAQLFVTTTLRHLPEAGVTGMLVRLGEVLRTFEPGPLELAVSPALVGDVEAIIAARNEYGEHTVVVGDESLAPGEFRLRSEWADAEGTFERYMQAARNALEMTVVDDRP